MATTHLRQEPCDQQWLQDAPQELAHYHLWTQICGTRSYEAMAAGKVAAQLSAAVASKSPDVVTSTMATKSILKVAPMTHVCPWFPYVLLKASSVASCSQVRLCRRCLHRSAGSAFFLPSAISRQSCSTWTAPSRTQIRCTSLPSGRSCRRCVCTGLTPRDPVGLLPVSSILQLSHPLSPW